MAIERKALKQDKDKLVERLKENFTETENVILRRRSVRLYKKEQVPVFMIKRILEAGRFAPSAGNFQPWKFIVVRDEKIINDMTDTVVELCKNLRSFIDYRRPGWGWMRPIIKIFTWARHHDLGPVPFTAVSLLAERKMGLWYGAPTVILIFADTRNVGNPDLDCGIAGQNMVLAAHSMGLGTCWVGLAKPAFEYYSKYKKLFGISYPYKFKASLAIGWPVGEPDGMVDRQTYAVDWYENENKQTIY